MSIPERWVEMTREQAIDAAQDAETPQWTQIYLALAALLPPQRARGPWPTWPAPATATTKDTREIEITEEIEDEPMSEYGEAYWAVRCGARVPGLPWRCTLEAGHPVANNSVYDHVDTRSGDGWRVR